MPNTDRPKLIAASIDAPEGSFIELRKTLRFLGGTALAAFKSYLGIGDGIPGQYSATDMGLVADGIVLTDVSSTAGSAAIASNSVGFSDEYVGKAVTLYAGKHQNFSCSFTSGDATVTTASTANLVVGMRVSAVKAVSTTGSLTNGSTTVSSLGTTTGLLVGMIVSGNGICGGCTIISINTGASSMVISLAAEATTNPVALDCAKYVAPLDARIASVTNATTFEMTASATSTATVADADFVPGYLQTTIAAVTDAAHATLAANALATMTGGRMIIGTDNTEALQNALDDIYAAGGGVLRFPAGMCVLAGDLQDAAVRNSVIKVPNHNAGPITSISMVGTGTPAMESNGFLDYAPSLTGTVLFCATPASGTNPCMFSGNNSAAPGSLSSVSFQFRDLTFRRPQSSALGEMNFLTGGALIVEYCVIEPDYSTVSEFLKHAYPSAQTGIVFPNSNNGAFCNITNSRILGAGTAIMGSQHLCVTNVEIAASRVGVADSVSGGGGIIRVTNLHTVGCGINICVPTGGHTTTFFITGGVFENQGSTPFLNEWDFYDEGGTALKGRATVLLLTSHRVRISSPWMMVESFSGTHSEVINPLPISLASGQYFILRQLKDGGTPGFELQTAAGARIGLAFGFPDFGGQFIMQAGSGYSLYARNSDAVGLNVAPTSGKVTLPTLNLGSSPTSASGLSAGDAWSDSGTLKVV